jgi:hypothetical protein
MRNVVSVLRTFLVIVAIIAVVWIVTANYSFFFSKTISGRLTDVKRLNDNTAILGGGTGTISREALFSFAIAIQSDEDGRIYTSSSEDRQFAAAREGRCARVRIFPYPPWDLNSGGTYFNARLLDQYECPATQGAPAAKAETAAPPAQDVPQATPAAPADAAPNAQPVAPATN